MMTPFLVIFYICYLMEKKGDFFASFMWKGCKIFNCYFVINMIVLVLQLLGIHIFDGPSITDYSMLEDQICGLFGGNGTHCLTYYAVFIVIYNFLYYKYYITPLRLF
ncbi:MAG TPA: hypothetical protein DDY31_14190, partial [Lachnospiraceae bacterium]|nr:hypothetical protein [Lachnospiraceae bacterium]